MDLPMLVLVAVMTVCMAIYIIVAVTR